MGGMAQDEGERDRHCLLASRPSHIMQDDHSCERKQKHRIIIIETSRVFLCYSLAFASSAFQKAKLWSHWKAETNFIYEKH